MDHTLYDEAPSTNDQGVPYAISLKQSFTLDFNNARSRQPMDLGFLKLGSPELERYLVQPDCSVVTALTPTTQILFPKSVTEEQEAYARGFIDALEELHRRQGMPSTTLDLSGPNKSNQYFTSTSSSSSVSLKESSLVETSANEPLSLECSPSKKTSVLPPAQTLLCRNAVGKKPFDASFNAIIHGACSSNSSAVGSSSSIKESVSGKSHVYFIGEESLQTVPRLLSSPPSSSAASLSGDSPSPMSATDDVDRLEIKRARNRLAAQKCRSRKLERIAVLSQRVEELREQNARLQILKLEASQVVEDLKARLSEHARCGDVDFSVAGLS